jgi:hypothetical protein
MTAKNNGEVGMQSKKYFMTNTAIGAFFAVTNGGASMMMLANTSQWAKGQIIEAVLLSLVGLVVALLGIAAISKITSEERALNWQFLIISFLVAFLTIWGIGLLFQPLSRDVKISWLAGFLTGLAVYVYFLARQVKDSQIAVLVIRRWLPLLIIILLVDFSLFFRLIDFF